MRPFHIAWLVCGLVLAAFLALSLTAKPARRMADLPVQENVASVPLGGTFTLTDQDGKTVTDQSWPDKYLLLYFGFTHCPDICPLGLTKITEALNGMKPEMRARIQPILITVDPERDTAEVLKTYVGFFDKAMIGLTGTVEQIEHVKKLYRVYAEKQGDGNDYMVNHSGFTYFMTPDNQLGLIFAHETESDAMRKEITDYLNAQKR